MTINSPNLIKLSFFYIFFLSISIFSLNLPQNEFPDHLDIIILIDVSGSMEFALDGTYPAPLSDQRLTYIRPGLEALVTIFSRLSDQPPTGGGVSTKRFAVGRFPGIAPFDFSWLPQSPNINALRDYNAAELNNIISSVNVRWAGTPIGTAIIKAIEMQNSHLYTGPGSKGYIVILFTDGKRYGGEPIYKPGTSSGSINNVRNEIRNYIEHFSDIPNSDKIKIISLGFGDLSTASTETDFDMLNDISKYWDAFDPNIRYNGGFTKTAIYYAFSGMGYGQALSDPNFQINPGETQEHIFHTTRFDKKLVFLIAWSEPKTKGTLKLSLKNPSNETITPTFAHKNSEIIYDSGRTFQMYTISEKYITTNVGEWKLIVNGINLSDSEEYAYSILGNSELQLKDVSLPEDRAQYTGEHIKLAFGIPTKQWTES